MVKIESYEARGVVRWRVDLALAVDGTFRRARRQGFASEKEAKTWARRAELRFLEGQVMEPTPRPAASKREDRTDPREWTFLRVWEECERYWATRKAPTTCAAYASRWRVHLARFGGQVFGRMPQRTLDAIAACPAAPTFAAILKTCPKIGVTPPPGIWDPPPIKKSARLEYLEPDEARRVLAVLSPKYRRVFLFLLGTGCRVGEALGLQWGDLDFPNRLIHIERALCPRTRKMRLPKGKKTRVLPMSRLAEESFTGLHRGPATGLVFSDVGQCGFREELRNAGPRAGLTKNIHPHLARHTAASLQVQAGIPLEMVCALLGHSSLKVTQIYSHMAPKHMAAGVAAVDDLICL